MLIHDFRDGHPWLSATSRKNKNLASQSERVRMYPSLSSRRRDLTPILRQFRVRYGGHCKRQTAARYLCPTKASAEVEVQESEGRFPTDNRPLIASPRYLLFSEICLDCNSQSGIYRGQPSSLVDVSPERSSSCFPSERFSSMTFLLTIRP